MNVSDALTLAIGHLANALVDEPRLESASILAYSIGRDRTFLIAHPEYELSESELRLFTESVSRRCSREPFQYITGVREFCGFEFNVSPDVLIPRPETELLVENAVRFLSTIESPRFCEVGVGSGCISVSILKFVPSATALALDISAPALSIAKTNAEMHGVGDLIDLRRSDIFTELADERFHAIVSNPPYVPIDELKEVQPEVRDFEPHIALTDGGNGLGIIERIVKGSPKFLFPGGLLSLEFGFSQSESVKEMFRDRWWKEINIVNDFNGIPRIVNANRQSEQ